MVIVESRLYPPRRSCPPHCAPQHFIKIYNKIPLLLSQSHPPLPSEILRDFLSNRPDAHSLIEVWLSPMGNRRQETGGKVSSVSGGFKRVIRNTYSKTGESYGQILILKIKI